MKKSVVICLALGLLAAVAAAPAVEAKTLQRVIRLTGWIVDEDSGADHANAESKEAVLAKAADGEALVFYASTGETYMITNQEKALLKVGEQWDVFGMLDEDGNLSVGSYAKPKKKAPAATDAESSGTEQPQN